MTLIQPIESVDPESSAHAWRQHTFSMLGNYSDLAGKPWSELRHFEILPRCALDSPILVIPEQWMPAGSTRRLSFRSIDPADGGQSQDAELSRRRDEAIRRALLALWLPRCTQTGVRQLKPVSWIKHSNLLLRLAAWQFERLATEDGSVFGGLTIANVLAGVFPDIAPTERGRADLRSLLSVLIDAGRRGVISDWPKLYGKREDTADHPTIERGRRGEGAPLRTKKTEPRNWQPFSDKFVTEFIRRAIWLQDNIALPLINLWFRLHEITVEQAELGRSTSHPSVIEMRAKEIARTKWKGKNGDPIERLPFKLTYVADCASDHWPPLNSRELNRLISTIQTLNFSLVAFCTGARSSELSACRDADLQTTNDRLYSLSFKLIDRIGGKERDWPLHPTAVRAIALQHALARRVRPERTDHLWVILGDRKRMGQPLLNLSEPLVQAVEHLGLSNLTGRDRAHVHRWRHTVARLVALSVVGAPQVLLDLFGHRDLEMTLRYMLSDPDIVEDAMKVAKETSYAMAEEAIAETVAGETSGPAVRPLREGLEKMAMRRGEKVFDTSSLRETVEVLTFSNRYWSIVRHGVLCIKGLGEYGPCTRERGAPDPGACRTSCDYRLETSRAKKDCEEALRALIAERLHAHSQDEQMLVANLDGQILSHLKRWDDVRERVLAEHPDIRPIWEAKQ
jgi:integrase